MATSVIIFDKENKQDDYQFIAKDIDGNSVIGWIVIEKPWHTSESAWTYWMYTNKYGSGGFCGGASDLGLSRVQVKPETIKPYNQIEEIKCHLEFGMIVRLDRKHYLFNEDAPDGNTLAVIHNENEIPYELWQIK